MTTREQTKAAHRYFIEAAHGYHAQGKRAHAAHCLYMAAIMRGAMKMARRGEG